MLTVAVLVSGSGSNLQSIIDACERGKIDAAVVGVFSNRDDAFGLERARAANIPSCAIVPSHFDSVSDWELALGDAVERSGAELVVLAGFMRILGDGFVNRFQGRIMNIHPSLLPRFRGLNTHQRALDEGVDEHGATVHFVTAELDHGPIIIQATVPVLASDTAENLQQRVLRREHEIYPLAIGWYAEGKIDFSKPQP